VPKPPATSANLLRLPGSVYSPLRSSGEALPKNLCPLNVGDTWLAPPPAVGRALARAESEAGSNRYTETRGIPELVAALTAKLCARNGYAGDASGVIVTAGATAGLGCALAALVDPGDEVLILAPFWPLIRGIAQGVGALPVEVPFFDRVHTLEAALAVIRSALTPRSAVLYLASPSNPTGRVLPRAWLEAIAALARRENLWLISDEVYEDYAYRVPHASLLELAPERTIASFSFSKAYGMAGLRIGYLAGPAPQIAEAHKVGTHTYYCAPALSQRAALEVLGDGADWIARARSLYAEVGAEAAKRLGLPSPEGSTFLFFDAGAVLDGRGLFGFLEDCAGDGVALAPGSSSGSAYGSWVRLCYTAAPPEAVLAAVSAVAKRLGS
jgi:N-succinyldiaminopimelate aminotransferase